MEDSVLENQFVQRFEEEGGVRETTVVTKLEKCRESLRGFNKLVSDQLTDEEKERSEFEVLPS